MTRLALAALIVAGAGAPIVSQSSGTQAVPPSAGVSGRVIAADTGEPIPGASVRAAVVLTNVGAMPPPSLQTTTDATGNFQLQGLSAGRLNLTATADGYLPATYTPRQPSQIPQIQPGQQLTGITLSLSRAATISGRVLDDAGRPMPNIEVHAYQRGILTVRRAWLDARMTFRTDFTGRYVVTNARPGEYVVSVPVLSTTVPPSVVSALRAIPRAGFDGSPIVKAIVASRGPMPSDGFEAMATGGVTLTNGMTARVMPQLPATTSGDTQMYRTTYYPAATTLDSAGIITVRSGEARADADITLQRARPFRITGTLRRGNAPAPFTGVHLIAEDAGERSMDYDTVTALGATDLQGGFVLDLVPPGNYTLKVVVLPVPAGEGNPLAPPAIRLTDWASQPVRVIDRDVVLGDVPLRAPITVSGRVEFPGAGAMSPAATERSTVWLAAADGGMYSPPSAVAIRPDGTFELKGAMRSRYHLWGGGYPGWTVASVTAAGTDITGKALVVGERDIADVVIQLTSRPVVLTGLVVDANAAPVVEAEVLVFPVAAADWIANGMNTRVMRRVRSNNAGQFSTGGLPPGIYLVSALPAGSAHDYPDRRLFEAAEKVARSVTLFEGKPVDVRLLVGPRR